LNSRIDAALAAQDQRLLDDLQGQPLSDAALVDCCRLIIRYENSGPRTAPLAKQAQAQLRTWNLERREAFQRARKLWMGGYRPQLQQQPVGSGADAAQET